MRKIRKLGSFFGILVVAGFISSCATIAEQRKLENEISRMVQQNRASGGVRSQHAELAAKVDALQAEVRRLQGRLEVAEHQASSAVDEARAARAESYASNGTTATTIASTTSDKEVTTELAEYRRAYGAWRGEDHETCIDRFKGFLQTFPSSEYADDATYWMADCYVKLGDLKTAILRFDDVAGRYPEGNKAADALYRQGETLLELGPSYGSAARKAFERVVNEYPQSPRALEAKDQVKTLEAS